MFGKIVRREADIEYSRYRRKQEGKCQRCGSLKSLQVSHFYGRANEATRFFDDNCDVMCAGCHQYFTSNPALYTEWKKKQLGDQKYKMLQVAANTYQKRDDKKVLLFLGFMAKEKKDMCECVPPMPRQYCAMHMPRKKKTKKKESSIQY